jgi:transposase-like protein
MVQVKSGKECYRVNEVREKVEERRSSSGLERTRRIISPELRPKAVKPYREEKLPSRLVGQELGVGRKTVWNWVQRYRQSHPVRSQAGAV